MQEEVGRRGGAQLEWDADNERGDSELAAAPFDCFALSSSFHLPSSRWFTFIAPSLARPQDAKQSKFRCHNETATLPRRSQDERDETKYSGPSRVPLARTPTLLLLDNIEQWAWGERGDARRLAERVYNRTDGHCAMALGEERSQ